MDDSDDIIINELVAEGKLETVFSDTESSTSLSSDSEETPRKKLIRITNYVEEVVKKYSDEEFKKHFRMNRSTVYKIKDQLELSDVMPNHKFGRQKISSEKAVLLTVWYFSNTETFRQVSDRFNVTESSVYRVIKRVIKFLLEKKSTVIKWPTAQRAIDIEKKFRKIKGIRNVIGCIDGSHIEIPKPKSNQESYCNRKGYHSLLLQAIVASDKKFIDVFCGEPGSMNDARLLRKSPIYAKMIANPNYMKNYFLLGDSAYPSLNWIVPPFTDNGNLTREQREFNYLHSATRIVVENTFGLLKGRFRRLRKLDNLDNMFCSELIMCACIMHNTCIDENDFFYIPEVDFNQPIAEVPNDIGIINQDRRSIVFNELYNH